MTQVLAYLEDVVVDGRRVYRCLKCSHELGPTSANYKSNAGTFDEDIAYAEPEVLAAPSSEFVLRHYICPSCGVLLEVDMVRRTEETIHSVSLS